jgi:hypothetical protein
MAWKHIDKKWLEFASEVHNIRLKLALDGVNPFGDLNSCHSTWIVALLIYNLPPWLVTKRYFLMLALIIPDKEFYIGSNVDVYLQPLIDELQLLWKGVVAFDAYLGAKFNLKTICMWSIHDFSTYDLFAQCVRKGQVGCPPCVATTKSQSSKKLKKMVYCGTRRYLPQSHPYRWAKMAFNGKAKIIAAPIQMFITTIIEGAKVREIWLANPLNRARGKLDLVHKHGIK